MAGTPELKPRPKRDPNKTYCIGNNKTCWECGYRFKKTDTKWQEGGVCPNCGADRRCGAYPVNGWTVCRDHGAGSPKKGRPGGRKPLHKDIFNPDLPQRMLDTYRSAVEDNRLLQLRSDIAILEAIKHDQIKRIDTGESGATWTKLREKWEELEQALIAGNQDQIKPILNNIGRLIKKGYSEFAAERELQETIANKSKLTEKEIKHTEIAHRMVSIEKLMLWADRIADSIEARISDERERKLLLGDIYESMNVGGDKYVVDLPIYPIPDEPHAIASPKS